MFIDSMSGMQPSMLMKMGRPPSSSDMANKIANGIESGKLDADKVASRLESRFGEAAKSVIKDDGSVNVDELTTLIEDNRPNISGFNMGFQGTMPGMAGMGNSPFADELVTQILEQLDSGELDTDTLSQRLENNFGEDAQGIITEGSIDESALSALLEQNIPKPSDFRGSQVGMMNRQDTPTMENLQSMLNERFSSDQVEGVFNADGSLNIDELRNLFVGSQNYSGNLLPGFLFKMST